MTMTISEIQAEIEYLRAVRAELSKEIAELRLPMSLKEVAKLKNEGHRAWLDGYRCAMEERTK